MFKQVMNKLFQKRNDGAVKTGNNLRVMFHSTSHEQSKQNSQHQPKKNEIQRKSYLEPVAKFTYNNELKI